MRLTWTCFEVKIGSGYVLTYAVTCSYDALFTGGEVSCEHFWHSQQISSIIQIFSLKHFSHTLRNVCKIRSVWEAKWSFFEFRGTSWHLRSCIRSHFSIPWDLLTRGGCGTKVSTSYWHLMTVSCGRVRIVREPDPFTRAMACRRLFVNTPQRYIKLLYIHYRELRVNLLPALGYNTCLHKACLACKVEAYKCTA